MDYLAEDYQNCGKGCNRGTGSGDKQSLQVPIAITNISLIYSLPVCFLMRSSSRGDRAMSPRTMPFSQLIAQERRRWMPFRRALSKEDQEAFDRMCACAKQQL
jgi:hypothetical protein